MHQFTRKWLLCLLGAVLVSPVALAADPVSLKPDHPTRYTVQSGDTLWGISGRFLNDPWRWPDLWHSNPQVKNPDRIYPGDELELVTVDGKPRLVKRGGRSGGGSSKVVKLSPSVRVQSGIPPIPLDAIRPFLSRPVVVDDESLIDQAPYVLAFPNSRIRGGTRDRMYARGIAEPIGTRFDILRRAGELIRGEGSNELRGADSNELLGYGAVHIGIATLVAPGDPATLEIDLARIDIRPGDRLRPVTDEDRYTEDFQPRAPEQPIYGSIIHIMGGLSQGGQYNVVVLDRGARDGLVAGDVLRIDQKGRIVRDRVPLDQGVAPQIRPGIWGGIPQPFDDAAALHDLRPAATPTERFRELRVETIQPGEPVKLPDEEAGLLMVFRTYERLSVGLVMQATRPINVGDRVRNP
ncbi:MAG: LysM peptidoglycan-binding domain-containing protein [Acidobacteria bacterium]|jgi:hypothetical protein|nr:LysM peptidoglycan-binding domain-containing protein [Acidobacteriota bacterium]